MTQTEPAEPVRLFSSDLDGTLIGNPEAAQRFKTVWEKLPARERPLLVYCSGRLVDDVRRLYNAERRLPAADYVIGGVGTEVYDEGKEGLLDDFKRELSTKWDLQKVRDIVASVPGIRPQPEHFLTEFKSSWFLDRAQPEFLRDLERRFEEAGLDVQIVYSANRDLDLVPGRAGKGGALRWLCARLEIPLTQVLVAGDTGNDSSMFLLPGVRGIVVENAQPELFEATVDIPTYTARRVMGDGVLDGLRHFGVITRVPAAGTARITAEKMEPGFRMLFTGVRLGPLDDEERKYLRLAHEMALAALKRCITPLGFAACSPADNPATGTDANYHSVWARDGAFTVLETLDLDDPDLRAAQRRTLDTLLDAVAPTGQIPSNVRLEDGAPDYSGVGNICSVDGGLWVIYTCYHYFAKTGDQDFLRRHGSRLQVVMNWLTAHDSNNDGLLEIPEAGDWTDLFGRSYNVLYDEVLWYGANVAYGRLLEFQGQYARAADYLRWARHIRSRVLDSFWPTTAPPSPDSPHRFADRQFTLGDTLYLIAEVTPFSFNWRCDVLGNLLAYHLNLLDTPRARTLLRFLWGVGVNQPWPVANLYPVVQAGDPDWRAYYTVNLLNLPHHYHNGGAWPFVGGLWVRFLHRLGFHEVACRELVRLAQANQLGRDQEWEFNEWLHGATGRPMGKAFQAWSAASFLRACRELDILPKQG